MTILYVADIVVFEYMRITVRLNPVCVKHGCELWGYIVDFYVLKIVILR